VLEFGLEFDQETALLWPVGEVAKGFVRAVCYFEGAVWFA
jgi:hypothetical protein